MDSVPVKSSGPWNRSKHLLTVLLEAGGNPDVVDPEYYGATPLMRAAESNDVALMKLLLAHGATVDALDARGDSALNWVAYFGWVEAGRILLEARADPRNVGHGDALDIAMWRGHRCPGPRRQHCSLDGRGLRFERAAEKAVRHLVVEAPRRKDVGQTHGAFNS